MPPGDPLRDDPLLSSLRALPTPPLAEAVSDRVLARARSLLPEAKQEGGVLQALGALWARVLAPALVTATVATYLFWAVHAASALYR